MPVSDALNLISNIFGWAATQTQLKNAPDVRKAAIIQAKIDELAKAKNAVSKEDVDATRKLLSR